MSIETVNYITDLDPTKPGATDAKSEGDDHIRNIKTALHNAIKGFTGSVLVTGTDGGSVNAYTLTPTRALPSYSTKMSALFIPNVTNTGATTLNISGLGALAVKRIDGAALTSGDLQAGSIYTAFYNGTEFRLTAVTKNYTDQIVVSGTVPGVTTPANAGKFFTTDGTNGSFQAIDGRGSPLTALGNSGTAAQTLAYSATAEAWTLTVTGVFNLSASGFPAGRISGGVLNLTNGGAFAWTSSGITWKKSDGTESATLAGAGYTFKTSGKDQIAVYSFGDGTVYGKLL